MMRLCLTRRHLCSLSPRRTSHNSWIAEWLNGRHALAVQTTEESEANLQDCNLLTFARPSL